MYQDWATADRLQRLQRQERNYPTRRSPLATFKPLHYALALFIAGYVSVKIGYVEPRLPNPWTPVTVAAIPRPEIPEAEDALLEYNARLLAGVALGEDRNAAVAVMWVVINRAQGRPILEAVTEKRAFGSLIRGHFYQSWSLDPYDRWRHPMSHAELRRLEGIAQAILLGYIPDPTGGAQFFHRNGTWTPPWAPDRDEWERHGSHWFYKGRYDDLS